MIGGGGIEDADRLAFETLVLVATIWSDEAEGSGRVEEFNGVSDQKYGSLVRPASKRAGDDPRAEYAKGCLNVRI